MPTFGKTSLERLGTCDERLQRVFKEVIKYVDCTIICGHRGEKEQNEAFAAGNSKKQWPNGEHNKTPSRAVDAAPYPVDWNDSNRFRFFAGFVVGVAATMGVKIRWGDDWDRDLNLSEHAFKDLPHFEVED